METIMANSNRPPGNPVAYAGPAADAPVYAPPPVMPPPNPPVPVQTPSQAITAAANEIIRVADSRGRILGFRKLGVLEKARMFQILGPEDAKNEPYLAFAVPAFMTVEIDGRPLPPLASRPNTPAARVALDGVITLLGDEGIEAVNQGIIKHFGEQAEAEGGPQNAGIETVKN
jgi:hypothetical protein